MLEAKQEISPGQSSRIETFGCQLLARLFRIGTAVQRESFNLRRFPAVLRRHMPSSLEWWTTKHWSSHGERIRWRQNMAPFENAAFRPQGPQFGALVQPSLSIF